jgi:hypothetical protein
MSNSVAERAASADGGTGQGVVRARGRVATSLSAPRCGRAEFDGKDSQCPRLTPTPTGRGARGPGSAGREARGPDRGEPLRQGRIEAGERQNRRQFFPLAVSGVVSIRGGMERDRSRPGSPSGRAGSARPDPGDAGGAVGGGWTRPGFGSPGVGRRPRESRDDADLGPHLTRSRGGRGERACSRTIRTAMERTIQ